MVLITSLVLLHLLTLLEVDPHQVGGGEVALEQSNAGLEKGHGEAEDGEDVEEIEGPAGEVGEIQHGVEQFIAFNIDYE